MQVRWARPLRLRWSPGRRRLPHPLQLLELVVLVTIAIVPRAAQTADVGGGHVKFHSLTCSFFHEMSASCWGMLHRSDTGCGAAPVVTEPAPGPTLICMALLRDGLVLSATIAAGVLGLFFAGPQLWRTFTTKSIAGLSAISYGTGAVSYALWVLYFVYYERYLVALSVAVPGVLWTVTLALIVLYMRRNGERVLIWQLLLPTAWFALAVSARIVSETWFNVVLSTSVLWAYLPALWAACRSADVSGVSTAT